MIQMVSSGFNLHKNFQCFTHAPAAPLTPFTSLSAASLCVRVMCVYYTYVFQVSELLSRLTCPVISSSSVEPYRHAETCSRYSTPAAREIGERAGGEKDRGREGGGKRRTETERDRERKTDRD